MVSQVISCLNKGTDILDARSGWFAPRYMVRMWLLSLALFVATVAHANAQGECSITYENQNQVDYGPIRLHHVQGILMDIASVAVPNACVGLFDEDEHPIATATSDIEGRFSFRIVARGKYRLVVRVEGFGVANVPLELVAWPFGGFFRTHSLVIVDLCTGVERTHPA
jgi:Carboxypeptidase regulatory-like domain